MLKLFNTLSKEKEEFHPIKGGEVGIYSCGPTVYDYAHVGNLRTYIFADILKRYLKYKGFKVTHVMNITDVGHLTSDGDTGEDKMEKGAKREGKTAWEIAEFYTNAFFEDAAKLNIEKPDIVPKATDHITEQIDAIKGLEEKGFVYTIEDGVYFDTSKLNDYGKLAGLDIEGLKAGARVEMVTGKRNPTDFALWKFSKPEEKRQMEWESPWGKGFPGWHIECSAMSMKYLGDYFDIHTGGIDHIPVHHTNEIAQAEGLTGKPFVKYWMHAEFLLVSAGRMGKSEGNLIKISDLESEGFGPLDYRYLCLTANYRDKLNFTRESLGGAKNTLNGIYQFLERLLSASGAENSKANIDEMIKKANVDFEDSLDDDLNMPKALAVLHQYITEINKLIEAGNLSKAESEKIYESFLNFDKVLGLDFKKVEEKEELPKELSELINKREEARKDKNFEESDKLRDELLERGIELEDTSQGVRWKRINK